MDSIGRPVARLSIIWRTTSHPHRPSARLRIDLALKKVPPNLQDAFGTLLAYLHTDLR